MNEKKINEMEFVKIGNTLIEKSYYERLKKAYEATFNMTYPFMKRRQNDNK